MIQDAATLGDFLPKLRAAPWVALDTEADSLHSYPEKLCLIQISLPETDVLIDPLVSLDLAPLIDALWNRELILHGADYDLRLLWRTLRFRPHAVFDTMWAARLLGYAEFGLGHLAERFLGVRLEKGMQRIDWAKRPLSEKMTAYAQNDTRHLQPLSAALRKELAVKGRTSWAEEVCARLVQECARDPEVEPDSAWRLKGSNRLDPRGLAVLREVWQWREAVALDRSRPPYFVMSHERVLELAAASAAGQDPEALFPRHLSDDRRAQVRAAIQRGMDLRPSACPKRRKSGGKRLTKPEQARVEELKQIRDQRALELQIDPSLIASRSQLIGLAVDWERRQADLMNWQRALLQREA